MNVELNLETTRWVEAELSSDRFRTAQDAVALARLGDIRAEIAAAELEGGEFISEEILRDVEQHLSEMFPTHGE